MENLQQKTFSGVMWGFLEKFSVQIVTFVVGVILARLLSPSDYGLIAITTVFIAISGTIVDSGFSAALIRKKDRTDLDYSTVFDINVVLSVVMCAILCISSVWIADFYHEPILIKIVSLNGLFLFLGSFISVQNTRLVAEMKFKTISVVNMVNSFFGGGISIAMAFSGFGVWSLVYPAFFRIISGAILYWHYQHWFPGIHFSKNSAKEMFSFGSKLLLSTIINTIYINIYPIVIGKKYNSADLGFYSKSSAFANLPSTTITSVLGGVAYPVLSNIQDDDERLSSVYRRILRLSAYLVFPIMMGMAALARPLIIALITIKWEQSIIYLQILCFAFMLYPIHALNLNLLQVKGRSDLFLRLEVLKKILGVSILIITIPMGLTWMCAGSVLSSYLCLYINTYYTGKLINVGFLKQMHDLLPSMLFSFSMGALIFIVIPFFHSIYMQLLIGFLVGILYYYLISLIFHSSDFQYLKMIINENVICRFRKQN